jgi:hypothetical protein
MVIIQEYKKKVIKLVCKKRKHTASVLDVSMLQNVELCHNLQFIDYFHISYISQSGYILQFPQM